MGFSEPLKKRARERAHYVCCICRRHGTSIEVHHIEPQAEGGDDTEDNAAPLCSWCHTEYGANPEKRKIIKEQRDFWYGICERRYAADPDRLSQMEAFMSQQFGQFSSMLEAMATPAKSGSRPMPDESDLQFMYERLQDVYEFMLCSPVLYPGKVPPDWTMEDIAGANAKIREIRSRYHPSTFATVPSNDDFGMGWIRGWMATIRWLLNYPNTPLETFQKSQDAKEPPDAN